MSRLLLIEDDLTLRRALCLLLQKFGHTEVEADNGSAGLKAHQAQPFELVITDLVMPEMEGIELIRALQKLSPKLPIIAISGGGRGSPESYLEMAKAFGAAVVLAKPFDLNELCAAVAQLLAVKESPELRAEG